jgi:DNA-directed RNA polymerase subunit beta
MGRTQLYKSIVTGHPLPQPSITESLKLLLNEMFALGLDTDIVTSDGEELMRPKYKPEQVEFDEDEEFEDGIGIEDEETEFEEEIEDEEEDEEEEETEE